MPQNYATRHMEAARDFPHGQRSLRIGDKFFATDVDAEYYKTKGQAIDVKAEAAKVEPAKKPEAPKPPVTTRQVAASAPVRTPPPAAAPAPTVPTAPAGVTTFADLNPGAAADLAKASPPADAANKS